MTIARFIWIKFSDERTRRLECLRLPLAAYPRHCQRTRHRRSRIRRQLLPRSRRRSRRRSLPHQSPRTRPRFRPPLRCRRLLQNRHRRRRRRHRRRRQSSSLNSGFDEEDLPT